MAKWLFCLGRTVNCEEKRTAKVINTIIGLYVLQFKITHYIASLKLYILREGF